MLIRQHAADLHEPTLAEELSSLGDDNVVEMTNLQEEDTGIAGVIFTPRPSLRAVHA